VYGKILRPPIAEQYLHATILHNELAWQSHPNIIQINVLEIHKWFFRTLECLHAQQNVSLRKKPN